MDHSEQDRDDELFLSLHNETASTQVDVDLPQSAISIMEQLTQSSGAALTDFVFFPLDNRVHNTFDQTDLTYRRLAEATIELVPTGNRQLDAVILCTKNGIVYGINQGVQVHALLRDFCNFVKPQCTQQCLANGTHKRCEGECTVGTRSKAYSRINNDFAILFIPDFIHDNTHFRRARFIGTLGCSSYFLELETANIREIEANSQFRLDQSVRAVFVAKSSISVFKLKYGEILSVVGVLLKAMGIYYNKCLRIVAYESRGMTGWVPVVVSLNDEN